MVRIEKIFRDLGYSERDGFWDKIKQYEEHNSVQMVFQRDREEIIIHLDYGSVSYFKAYINEDNSPSVVLISSTEHYAINQLIEEL